MDPFSSVQLVLEDFILMFINFPLAFNSFAILQVEIVRYAS